MPVRVELGPKDLAKGACVLARRDLPGKEAKEMGVPLAEAPAQIVGEMLQGDADGPVRPGEEVPRRQHCTRSNSYDEFKKRIEEPGGFFLAHWDGTRETEDRIAERDEGDDPLHSVRPQEGGGQVHGDGPAVGGAGGVREGVLISWGRFATCL